MFLKILAFLIITGLFSPASAQDKTFDAKYFKLDNGLEIVVIPNHRTPVITHMVWYRVGAADEPHGQSGIAHFLEHLMFKGSLGFGPGDFSKTIRTLGGHDNAFTSQDYTAYFQSVPARHLELVMRMEAGRMRGLNPPLEEVTSERKVILEERRQRTDNSPQARFAEPMATALFVNHPYGTPVIGWMHEMEKLSWKSAKSFYDQYYGPNNAILIVSGDVTESQVYELAKEIYGPLPRINLPERHWTKSPPLPAAPRVIMKDKSIRQPTVQNIFRVPSSHQNKNHALALQILEDIMGGGSTSRLYKALVIEQKIASSAGMSYRSDQWDDAMLYMYASPLPKIKPEHIENALKDELRKLIKNGVTASELAEAKTRMQDAAIYARDSLSGPAMVFGQALITGSEIDDVEYWPRDIGAITAQDVQEVAKTYLDPDKARTHPPVTGYLLPMDKEEEVAKK